MKALYHIEYQPGDEIFGSQWIARVDIDGVCHWIGSGVSERDIKNKAIKLIIKIHFYNIIYWPFKISLTNYLLIIIILILLFK